jgi:FtsP/CotA-like multicopper oxidase with cupredoxin domain
MPVKKLTARKKATAKKSTSKKKVVAKKAISKAATAKKSTAKKSTSKKKTAVSSRTASKRGSTKKREAAASGRTTKPARRVPGPDDPARPGDLIIIDSPQVGSAPREGEVLQVVHGEVSVSYRVRWTDGHETLIAPKSGAARIVRT